MYSGSESDRAIGESWWCSEGEDERDGERERGARVRSRDAAGDESEGASESPETTDWPGSGEERGVGDRRRVEAAAFRLEVEVDLDLLDPAAERRGGLKGSRVRFPAAGGMFKHRIVVTMMIELKSRACAAFFKLIDSL